MKTFCVTFSFLFFALIFAQNASGNPKVTIMTNPQDLTVKNAFTLSVIVDHPSPDDVSVVMPPFAGSLTLDRYIRAPRVNSAGVKQTAFEFRIIPNESGRITIDSLTIITPYGIMQTEPVIFNIREEEKGIYAPRLIWENTPQQIAAGDRVTLILRLDSRLENSVILPPPSFFMPEVPQNVILSGSTLSAQEKERGVVLKLTLIPLSAGNFNLNARTLLRENAQQKQHTRYNIPAVNIRITEKMQ